MAGTGPRLTKGTMQASTRAEIMNTVPSASTLMRAKTDKQVFALGHLHTRENWACSMPKAAFQNRGALELLLHEN